MAPTTLTVKDLNRATLARQMLLERAPVGAVEGVERLAGMQAQEPKHPYIVLWTRIEGFEAADLRAALLAREVVRATLMRSTLHLMSAAHYRALLRPRTDASDAAFLLARGRAAARAGERSLNVGVLGADPDAAGHPFSPALEMTDSVAPDEGGDERRDMRRLSKGGVCC